MMSTEKPKLLLLVVAAIALPIALGVMIEFASDLLRRVIHYFSTSIYWDVQNGMWRELTELDTWLGLAFAIALVALSTWVLDNWKYAHPSRLVRTSLLLISIILAAVFDPSGHVFRDKLLEAFKKAKVNEPMSVVLKRIQYSSPSLVEPHNEVQPVKNGSRTPPPLSDPNKCPSDCTGECWVRLIYEVPEPVGQDWISLDFGRDQDQKLTCKNPPD